MHTLLAPLSHNAAQAGKSKQLNAHSPLSGCLSIHILFLQGFSINIAMCRAINQNEREQEQASRRARKYSAGHSAKVVINYYRVEAVTDRAVLHLGSLQQRAKEAKGDWRERG